MAIADPRDISGLKVWYSAEAETGYTNDQAMTTWTDLSGNGNHATTAGTNKPSWQSGTGPGSTGPAVHFTGVGAGSGGEVTGHLTLPAGLMGSATAGEIFYKLRVDTSKPSNGNGHLHGIGQTDFCFYPYVDGTIYDGFGSNARKTVGGPGTGTIGAWHQLDIWSAASDYALQINGASTYSTASNSVAWHANPVIGTGVFGTGNPATSGNQVQPFKGWMTTVIIFNRKLTTGERSDLATWMAAHPNGGSLGTNGSVSAVAATASAAAGVPTVSAARQATVAAVAAVATAACLVPAVTGSSTVEPPAATGTAAALAPTVSTASGSTVLAPAANATAAALAPNVTGSATVTVTLATATGAAYAPTVASTRSAAVTAPAATATGTMRVPSVVAVAPQVPVDTPPERTLVVAADNRTLTIPTEDRTLRVSR